MYNGEIISYELSERPVLEQVIIMLKKAIDKTFNVSGLFYTQIKDGSTSIHITKRY